MKEITYNFIAILLCILILIATFLFRDQFNASLLLQSIGLIFVVTGMTFWIIGKLTLGKYFSVSHKPKALITKGIYSKLRHPMYTGGVLIYLGLALFFKSIVGLTLTIAILVPLLVYSATIEEKLLREKYKKDFDQYKKSVHVHRFCFKFWLK